VLSFDLVKWIAKNSKILRYLNNDDCALGLWLSALEGPRVSSLNSGLALDWNINSVRWLNDPNSYLFVLDVQTMQTYWQHLCNKLNISIITK
jgi:hypothetical protein